MDNDDWLIRQLEAWPTRVDAERTIEVRHLMQEAAQTLRSLHSALQGAVIWHQSADKALSKQPPSADGQWRRMEHQEQASNLATILAATPTPPTLSEDLREWHCPELRDLFNDAERLRNHALGDARWLELMRGVLDMLKAADTELACDDAAIDAALALAQVKA